MHHARTLFLSFLFCIFTEVTCGFCPISNASVSATSASSLGVCSRYSGRSCCTQTDANSLQQWLFDYQIRNTYGRYTQCLANLYTLYCGISCSPYQSQYVELANTTLNGTIVYGRINVRICNNFCRDIFQTCGDVLIADNLSIRQQFIVASSFCLAIAPFNYSITLQDTACFSGKEPADSSKSSVVGNNLGLVDESNHLQIIARDFLGNTKKIGGDDFRVEWLQVPFGYSGGINISDNQNGLYSISFFTSIAGEYLLSVYLGGAPIVNSPFKVQVTATRAGNKSYFECPKSNCGSLIAGEEIQFQIQAVDTHGNVATVGGDQFSVLVAGPIGSSNIFVNSEILLPHPIVEDNEDGTYIVSMCAKIAGEYILRVLANGNTLDGVCTIHIATNDFQANLSLVEVFQSGVAGEQPARIQVTLVDIFGNVLPASKSLGIELDVVSYTENLFFEVFSPNETMDSHLILVGSEVEGIFDINVFANSVSLATSNISLYFMPGDANGTLSIQTPREITSGIEFAECVKCLSLFGNGIYIASSHSNEFYIETHNCQNLTTSSFGVSFSQKNSNLTDLFQTSISDLGNGIFIVEYIPNVPIFGELELLVTISWEDDIFQLSENPIIVSFLSELCQSNCSNHGVCIDGSCACFDGFAGFDCATATLPELKSVRFGDNGHYLFLEFFSKVYVSQILCSSLFDSLFMKNLGGEPKCCCTDQLENVDCIISNEMEMIVKLGSGASILPGDTFTFLEPGNIATGRATVLPPKNPVSPVVDIRGYHTLAKCQDTFTLDASNSRGGGGRKFSQIQWGIDETDFGQLSKLLESETKLQLALNSSLLIPYVTYSFRLTLTNFLGKQSSSVFKITRSLENSVMFVEAPESLMVDVNSGFSLTSYVFQCENPLQHQFYWSQQLMDGKFTGNSLFSAQSSILYIPPLSFTPGSKVTFTVTSTLSLSASVEVTFLPEQSKIIVSSKPSQITSGITPYYLLFSRNSNFHLNLLSSETVSTSWTCKSTSSSSNCDSCLDNEVADIYFFNSSLAVLPAATFHPGSYTFHSGATSVQIDLVSQNSPIVNIFSSLEQKQFNADEKIVLFAHAGFANQITELNEFTFIWSIQPFVDLGSKSISPTGNSSNALILLPRSLPPQDYQVTLEAFSKNSNFAGKAKIVMKVNQPPTGGTCTLNQEDNEVFVQCSDWEDPDDSSQSLPIFYLPSVANSEGVERILLLERIPNNHFSVTIPKSATIFYVTVSDYFGAKFAQKIDLPTNGKRKQDNNLELAKNKTNLLSSSIGYLDTNSIIQRILSISSLINELQGLNSTFQEFADKQAIRLQLSQFLSSVELADNAVKLLVRVQLLEEIALIPQELLPNTQSLLWQEVVSALTLSASTGFSRVEEISNQIGNSFVNTISKLLQASKNSSESTILITKALKLLTKSLLVYSKTTLELPTEISSSLVHIQLSRESSNSLLLQRNSSLGVSVSLDSSVRDQISVPVVDVAFVTFIEPPLLSASSDISTPTSLLSFFSPTGEELSISLKARSVNYTFTSPKKWEFVTCSSWNDNSEVWANSSCSLQRQTWGNNSYITCSCPSTSLGFISAVETEAPAFPPGSSPSPLLQQNDQILEQTTSRKKLFWLLSLIGIVGVAIIVALLWWNRGAEETIIYKQQPPPQQHQAQTPILMSNVIIEDSSTVNINKSLVYGDTSESEESISLNPHKIAFGNETISDDEYSTKVAQKAIASLSTQATTEQTGLNFIQTKEEAPQKANSQNASTNSQTEEEQEEGLKRRKSMKEEDSSESDSSTSSNESEEEVMKRTIKKSREESDSSESSSSDSSSQSSTDS